VNATKGSDAQPTPPQKNLNLSNNFSAPKESSLF